MPYFEKGILWVKMDWNSWSNTHLNCWWFVESLQLQHTATQTSSLTGNQGTCSHGWAESRRVPPPTPPPPPPSMRRPRPYSPSCGETCHKEWRKPKKECMGMDCPGVVLLMKLTHKRDRQREIPRGSSQLKVDWWLTLMKIPHLYRAGLGKPLDWWTAVSSRICQRGQSRSRWMSVLVTHRKGGKIYHGIYRKHLL